MYVSLQIATPLLFSGAKCWKNFYSRKPLIKTFSRYSLPFFFPKSVTRGLSGVIPTDLKGSFFSPERQRWLSRILNEKQAPKVALDKYIFLIYNDIKFCCIVRSLNFIKFSNFQSKKRHKRSLLEQKNPRSPKLHFPPPPPKKE